MAAARGRRRSRPSRKSCPTTLWRSRTTWSLRQGTACHGRLDPKFLVRDRATEYVVCCDESLRSEGVAILLTLFRTPNASVMRSASKDGPLRVPRPTHDRVNAWHLEWSMRS